MSKPGDKLDKALQAYVKKLNEMHDFKKTEKARQIAGYIVFIVEYDWAANGSPGPASVRGGYQPMFTLIANEGDFAYEKDAPPKGDPLIGLRAKEDDLISFISNNNTWATQNFKKWDGFGVVGQAEIGWAIDELAWATYQIDGDKGIKDQVDALPLEQSFDDFYQIYFAIRKIKNGSEAGKKEFLAPFKADDIYDFAVQGTDVDPSRLRINLKDWSVTINPPRDDKATLTFLTDDATFHEVFISNKKNLVSDEKFKAKKITAHPAPKDKAAADWAQFVYKHLDKEFEYYKGST
ncbi:uncharacterized protein LOC62_07G009507 [Vanrija pseudolonga]|uniref:Uncharacterized protein n=1 Tax=Vanrija pseudolonga TaxID=143232 RepID=A0AAF0YL02_9TREE|nr:hypothetical protein LOC62_07G009507 [Vanrija pseudolonga]